MNLRNCLPAITVCTLMILPTAVKGRADSYQTYGTHVIAGQTMRAQVYVPEQGLNLKATFNPNNITGIRRILLRYDYSIQSINAVPGVDYRKKPPIRGTIFWDLRGPGGDGQGDWVLRPNPNPNITIHVPTFVNDNSTDHYRSLYIVLSNPTLIFHYQNGDQYLYGNIAESGLPNNPDGIMIQDNLATGIPSTLKFIGLIFRP